ncbi:Apoptosis antagonizing transcription factor domain containing protein, partial [Amanita muscaria]
LSLAEQIAQLEEPAPVDFDPEDIIPDNDREDLEQKDIQAAREHYLDVGPSTIRKYDSIADPKYQGVRTTRKSLLEDIEDEDDSEMRSASEGEEQKESSEEEGEEQGIPPATTTEAGEKRKPSAAVQEMEEEDMSSALRQKREQDRQKGRAVSRQIAIWDAILEARIRVQKAVNAANRLPRPNEMDVYTRHPQCRDALDKMLNEAMRFSDELFDLQEYLLTKNDNVSVPPRKKRRVDNDSQPDYEDQLKDASEDAAAFEHAMHPWLVQTLHKWSAKVQAVAPSVLLPSNRNAFSKNSQQTKSVVQLVEETLSSGHDKLLSRTRVRRGKDGRITDGGDQDGSGVVEEDQELFDDTDFYHQLLRDVIDSKGGLEDDWMAIQKEKKAKKKVDTKASKGRKIRYQVHDKLQNFMVPVPIVGAWHEEQVDELFGSLLGKGYENGGGGGEDVMQNGDNNTMAELESQLLKVFG